jgi:hypothetical protein
LSPGADGGPAPLLPSPPAPAPLLDRAFDRWVGEPPPPPGHPARTAFVLLAGTVLPILLLVLDQNWTPFDGMVGVIDVLPARPWSSVGIHLLAALLVVGAAAGPWAAAALRGLAAGAHAAGALAALLLGLYLLPFSIAGLLLLGLGLLGMVPFVSALAHVDAALDGGSACSDRHGRAAALALGGAGLLLLAGAVRLLGDAAVREEARATTALLAGPAVDPAAEARLHDLRRYAGIRLEELRNAIRDAPDPDPRDLRASWRRITGWEFPPDVGD